MDYKQYAASLCAQRLTAPFPGMVSTNIEHVVIVYMSDAETAHERALAECKRRYPEANGYSGHGISVVAVSPAIQKG